MTYNTPLNKCLRILLFVAIIAVSGVLFLKSKNTEKHPEETTCAGCPNKKSCEKALAETKDVSVIKESHE